MKRALLAAAAAGAALAAGAQPVGYRLDPTHSFVHFEVMHFGTATLRGRFGPLDGVAALDRSAQRGEVSLTIPTRIVSTGLPVLDSRLRQGDLFASEAYPEAYFVARNFVFEGDAAQEKLVARSASGRLMPRSVNSPRTSRSASPSKTKLRATKYASG